MKVPEGELGDNPLKEKTLPLAVSCSLGGYQPLLSEDNTESICFQTLSLDHSIRNGSAGCFDWELCTEKRMQLYFICNRSL